MDDELSEIIDATCICPYCDKPVSYKWVRNAGFVSEPHNVLVADCVYHAECWDEMVEEDPPQILGTE